MVVQLLLSLTALAAWQLHGFPFHCPIATLSSWRTILAVPQVNLSSCLFLFPEGNGP